MFLAEVKLAFIVGILQKRSYKSDPPSLTLSLGYPLPPVYPRITPRLPLQAFH